MIYVDVRIEGNSIYPCVENGKKFFTQQLEDANAIGCFIRMDKIYNQFSPFYPGWGLTEFISGRQFNPVERITNQKIEMTDWELLDLSIQIVRYHLTQDGKEITSWQSNLKLSPPIWF